MEIIGDIVSLTLLEIESDEEDQNIKKRKRSTDDDNNDLNLRIINKKILINHNDLFCPISKQMFLYPVVTNDGFTYERWVLEKLISEKGISPMTRESIDIICENKIIAATVNNFLEMNPQFKQLQFDKDTYILNYRENKDKFMKLLKNKEFNKLSEFKEIFITDSYQNKNICIIQQLIHSCSDTNILKKILDNCVDLNFKSEYFRLPMYYITIHGNSDLIIYCIKKKLELLDLDKENSNILMLILDNDDDDDDNKPDEAIKYIIDNNSVDFFAPNKNDQSGFSKLLSSDSHTNMANYMIDKLLENEGFTENCIYDLIVPIDLELLLKSLQFEMIKKILSRIQQVTEKAYSKQIIIDYLTLKMDTFQIKNVKNIYNFVSQRDDLKNDEKGYIYDMLESLYFNNINLSDIYNKICASILKKDLEELKKLNIFLMNIK